MRLILLGPPGAGKGTQARVLAEHFGVPHISSGSLIRGHVAAGTELGRTLAVYVEQGELAPDDLVMAVVAGGPGRARPGDVPGGLPRASHSAAPASASPLSAMARAGPVT